MPARLKLTEKMIERAAKYARDGNFDAAICRVLQITDTTWRSWFRTGQDLDRTLADDPSLSEKSLNKGERLKLRFFRAVTHARGELEVELVKQWIGHGKKDYRAIKDFMERRFHERWKSPDKHEISGPGGRPVEVHGAVMGAIFVDPEAMKLFHAAVEQALGHSDLPALEWEDEGETLSGGKGNGTRNSTKRARAQKARKPKGDKD